MKKIEILLVSAAAFLCTSVLHAGDTRVWTSRKGTTLEGELLKADVATATVVDKAAKQTIIKMEDLSIADRQYIVQYKNVDAKILAIGEVGEPEKEYRVDEKTFVKDKDNKLTLGAANLEILRTDHFLIGYSGEIRPNVIGEAAERIWHGMAFQHMDFRRDWGAERMMIIVDNDRKSHAAVGKWYFQYLKDSNRPDDAGKAATSWDEPNLIGGFEVPPDIATKYGIKQDARYFNAVETAGLKKALSPGLIHSIAAMMLSRQIGGFTETGSKGAPAVMDGHAYYKEYTLTGEITTGLVSTGGTDNLATQKHEISHENWPKTLKAAVKKGNMKLSLETTLGWTEKDFNPETLAAMFGLSYYLQSTNLRLSYYARLIQQVSTNHGVPIPVEFAKIYGFDSVEAFNADWTAFVMSTSFK